MTNKSFLIVFAIIAMILTVLGNTTDYIVISSFPDKYNLTRIYEPGEIVPTWFTKDHIDDLLSRNLIIANRHDLHTDCF